MGSIHTCVLICMQQMYCCCALSIACGSLIVRTLLVLTSILPQADTLQVTTLWDAARCTCKLEMNDVLFSFIPRLRHFYYSIRIYNNLWKQKSSSSALRVFVMNTHWRVIMWEQDYLSCIMSCKRSLVPYCRVGNTSVLQTQYCTLVLL